MSEVPAGWSEVTLEDVCCFYAGYGFPTAMQGRKGQELPFYKVRDVSIAWNAKSKFLLETENSLSMIEATSIRAKPLPTGSVVFAKIGEALRLNRRAVTSAPSLIDNNMMGMWAPPELVDPRFLYWYSTATRFDSDARASVVPSIRKSDVAGLKFHLPPRHEQTRIVDKLEELLSDLDAGVVELKAAQKKLALYRQSLLKAAVEGALTADWRARCAARGEPLETGADLLARILTERRARWEARQLAKFKEQCKTPPKGWQAKYPEPAVPKTADLPELPEGWVWTSVDALLFDIEAGKSFKCDERPPQDDETGVVKVSAVSWGEYDEEESKTCRDETLVRPDLFIREGDFLFSRANTIELVGACLIASRATKRIMLSDKILRFRLADDTLAPWLLTVLRGQIGRTQIQNLSSGNQDSMRNIGQERIRQILVPLPPKKEINEAERVLTACQEHAAGLAAALNHSLKQFAAQRKNLLKAAFSGQLVPQDPNDEPASALLARIRAERAASGHNTRRQRQKQETP